MRKGAFEKSGMATSSVESTGGTSSASSTFHSKLRTKYSVTTQTEYTMQNCIILVTMEPETSGHQTLSELNLSQVAIHSTPIVTKN